VFAIGYGLLVYFVPSLPVALLGEWFSVLACKVNGQGSGLACAIFTERRNALQEMY